MALGELDEEQLEPEEALPGENVADEKGHQMSTPEEAEPVDVAIKRKHVLLGLGGLVAAGILIFAGWEYVRHRLRKRRLERVTGNISDILRSGADVMHEMRMMSPDEAPPIPEPEGGSVLPEDAHPIEGAPPEGSPDQQVKMPGNEIPVEGMKADLEGPDGAEDDS